ncbi:MAG: RsmB/NOP family class I SAM-dependent RNA methyltransferase [Gemmatimonadota bacterium]|nr:RsmB/NOP family class I SAM-dependent RNA methyltransferase [Gemmatimonadota bacterium]
MSIERYRSIIPRWNEFTDTINRPEPTVLRVRRGRIAPADLVERLEAQGYSLAPLDGMPDFFQVVDGPRPVSFTLEHWMGLFYVQQASTGVAAPALAPLPGERVLDLCSAPGGKTTHMAELMEDRGALVASDVSEGRIRGLLGNVYRLGHPNIMVVSGDGRSFPEEACFDRVLVDAPCSGEGTLRKKRGTPPRQSTSFMGYVTRAQEELLRKAVRITRPGGTILYVTCTFSPEENEAVVDRVLREEPVEMEPLTLPVPHEPGVTEWEGRRFDPRLAGTCRVYPHHFDSGGLYLAKLRRLDGAGPCGAEWTPVPSVFPGEEMAAGEAEALGARAREFLTERFALPPEILDGFQVMFRGGRAWFHTLEGWPAEAWSQGPWRPVSVGFRAVEFDGHGRPRPTNDLLQWLGPALRAGVLDLTETELRRLLEREDLGRMGVPPGYLALGWEGTVLGRGFSTGEEVRSEVPKTRVADLARIF